MIDCHNHLLPDIDDGAHDDHMMVAMARVSESSGVTDILCTPHHLNGSFVNRAADILDHVSRAQAVLDDSGIGVRLHPGSELHLCPELTESLECGHALTVKDARRFVLLECPKNSLPKGTMTIIDDVTSMGLTPIIVHPERNLPCLANPALVEQMLELGCCIQVTAMSCTGQFGLSIERAVHRWIQRGWVHVVASDAHRPSGRSPDLLPARRVLERLYGDSVATTLLLDNPRSLLDGMPLEAPRPPRPTMARRVASFFTR